MAKDKDRALRLALFGTDEEVPAPRLLAAGPLSCELIDGNLRNIRFNGIEVLRAISFVVRDTDWGTYAPAISDLAVEADDGRFCVRYAAACDGSAGARLAYRARISGDANHLAFEAEAVPSGDFLTNRTGFTILHPVVGVAGAPAEVEHVDGSMEHARFPELIDPAQPFKEMRAMAHQVTPGVRAVCRMEGDTFEMEDQRNWSDASYKTYVRPLALPWPYVLPAGVPLRQHVRLDINTEGPLPAVETGDAPVSVTLGGNIGRLPGFGLVVTPEEARASLASSRRLWEIAPQTLLFHVDPTAGHGPAALADFAGLAASFPAENVLECVVPCERPLDEELGEIAGWVADAGLRLDAIAVSPSVDRRSTPPGSVWPACPPLAEVYAAARRAFPGLTLGGGTFSYFTELNRKRPPVELLDYVTHCTCPIVHDADDRSVMESLEALPFILRSVRAIIGAGTPYRIGPSTLGMRQNPYGSRTIPNPERRRMTMTDVDPRQHGLFAAAWMTGYAARLAQEGVEAFIGAALTGPFGVTEGHRLRPAAHAARFLAGIGDATGIAASSSDEARVLALAAQPDASERMLLIANLTAAPQRVDLPFAGQAQVVDEDAVIAGEGARAETLATAALILKPYAVARIEG